MYLGALGTLTDDLGAMDARLWQSTRDYSSQAAYYIGYMQDSNVDPIMWGDLKAKAEQLASMLPAWRKKYAQLQAVKGQVEQAEWDRCATELVNQGTALANSIDSLNTALRNRKIVSSILGNFGATIGILTRVVAIQIPAIVLNTAKGAVTGTVKFAGETLATAGSAIGNTAAGIIEPIKGTLWLVLGIVGIGAAAYLYTLAPKGKRA